MGEKMFPEQQFPRSVDRNPQSQKFVVSYAML